MSRNVWRMESIDELNELLKPLEEERESVSAEDAVRLLALAERLLRSDPGSPDDADGWHRYLDCTGRLPFMQALGNRDERYRWAETTFPAVLRSGYSLEDMLEQRVQRHPDRILFREASGSAQSAWTYAQISHRLKSLAGLFCRTEAEPRVAIYCDNGVDSACCDLACLVHRIFDTPLNVHYDAQTLVWIFDRLAINIVVTDTEERLLRIEEARKRCARAVRIYYAGASLAVPKVQAAGAERLTEACARLDMAGLDALLAGRRCRTITDAATVMFTSGSTGEPKGIAFTQYHLLTKRFARAAALPAVGDKEVLLCYLPLFHTFGRYFEMLGMIYWGGTYVFAGNPSAATLISQLQEVRPTGLISVPLRWSQIRDYCLENTSEAVSPEAQRAVFRSIVGERLRWGLSAAGYLDPRVFRYFQRHDVDLCSGFGMTEATGGITMTPPGEYVDRTVGLPLPGIRVRFGNLGELEIAGHYVARYIEGSGGPDLPRQDPGEEYWLATGDIFKERPRGYLEIVDRIKDIYKNNRGQTIAPRRVEQKFDGVPGIRRVFLVGDGRDSNVLLIVPDRSDHLLNAPDDGVTEYLHQIIAAANVDLAPYERIINFAVLERDLEQARGELTAKGSFRRKTVEKHFAGVIETLYRGNYADLPCGNVHVHIPRWFFRDRSLLEHDIVADDKGLFCPGAGSRLPIASCGEGGWVRIGDLEYCISEPVVDLGLFARQPRLWVGNPSLAAFCPCKDGWDLPLRAVSTRVRLPWRDGEAPSTPSFDIPHMRDTGLRLVHRLCAESLFHPKNAALAAAGKLEIELQNAGDRLSTVIRSRLEALARHPEEDVRCLAYRVLLADKPTQEYSRVFPAFIESGLTFLNEESIDALASSGLGDKRLQSLRLRLFGYRTQLSWPASETTRKQLEKVFDLLTHIARRDPSYYGPVRAELASWALHRADPPLAEAADMRLSQLRNRFEYSLGDQVTPADMAGKIVYADGIATGDVRRLDRILCDPAFLKQSILLAFDEKNFELDRIPANGVWVARILGQREFDLYRAGINLSNGRHFDLLLLIGDKSVKGRLGDTINWLTSLAEHPSHARVIPRFGACRPDLGAMSVAYVSNLTVWEKIREYSGALTARAQAASNIAWRRLFVRGMAAFFSAWNMSGGRIIPGAVAPENVAVPDVDFREGTHILSMTRWQPYEGPLSLVQPFVRNFYRQTAAYYPGVPLQLDISWIFDACMESLGPENGNRFLAELGSELSDSGGPGDCPELAADLADYRRRLQDGPYLPLPLLCAVQRYAKWESANLHATHEAREEEVDQVYRLYRINRYPQMFRYYLFRHTFFRQAEAGIHGAFDRLLLYLHRNPGVSPIHLRELSALQEALGNRESRDVFSRMIFPQARSEQHLEVVEVGDSDWKQVIVRSDILDRYGMKYTVREPVSPQEIGQLYHMLHDADYPKQISEQDRHLVIADSEEQIVGGLTYVPQDKEVVYLNGIVVSASLSRRGLGSSLLEDFYVRLQARGVQTVKTDFFMRHFYSANGFQVDKRWGGLVRQLRTPE